MEMTIEGKMRSPESKANRLRRDGFIPAVLYGHDGGNSVSLVLDKKDAETLCRNARANTTPIQLNVPEMSWSGKTVLREIHTHPAKGFLYHLSFFSIEGKE